MKKIVLLRHGESIWNKEKLMDAVAHQGKKSK